MMAAGGGNGGVLTGEESSRPDEDIRICISHPVGDCVVDL